MNNYNNNEPSIELQKMEVQAELMQTLDSALQVVTKLNEAVIYLNFENHDMIKRYYDSLDTMTEGFQFLKDGFASLASSYGIEVAEVD